LVSTACFWDNFTLSYVEDVCNSQETHVWVSKSCYKDSFTFLNVESVRTSQQTHTRASRECYEDSLTNTFYPLSSVLASYSNQTEAERRIEGKYIDARNQITVIRFV
jgi:hypothetical protein